MKYNECNKYIEDNEYNSGLMFEIEYMMKVLL